MKGNFSQPYTIARVIFHMFPLTVIFKINIVLTAAIMADSSRLMLYDRLQIPLHSGLGDRYVKTTSCLIMEHN